jgi:hypothetical protein
MLQAALAFPGLLTTMGWNSLGEYQAFAKLDLLYLFIHLLTFGNFIFNRCK